MPFNRLLWVPSNSVRAIQDFLQTGLKIQPQAWYS
ncbi:hypothetical protein J762_3560, partial [Acinetobacter baumannii 24845_9]